MCSDFIIILLFTLIFTGLRINGSSSFSLIKVTDEDVRFLLYTRRNPHISDELRIHDADSIINSHLNTNIRTKMIIHGWRNHGNSSLNYSIREAYLTVSDANVISVDWALLSRKPYPVARLLVSNLADKIANMIDFLVQLGVSLHDVHVIGHSLGAHVAGIVGQKITSGRLPRITGLDPAGPLFTSNNQGRLDKSDAEFVDVIHTSGLCLGYFAPLGHVDFYPNRGIPIQPGCGLDVIGRCSHQRSYWLFAESILNRTPFLARHCFSWSHYKHLDCTEEILMGEYVNKDARGQYYLRTNSIKPFAIGNSSYYAQSPVIDDDIPIINDTFPVIPVTEFEETCECSNGKTASVLRSMYKKVGWKKIRDKIDDWMKDHDCDCYLHSKTAAPITFIS